MSQYRNHLPQLSNDIFLTDGGIETTLIFKHGYDLPEFAAFDLFKHREGYQTIQNYYRPYIELARKQNVGFVLESPTWRASKDWGAKIGYSEKNLHEINRMAIGMFQDFRNTYENQDSPFVISGCIGPRGDGYNVDHKMSVHEAEHYHRTQVETFRKTEADMVSAITLTYPEEAIGITRAAESAGLPSVIGFTVETDGRLPSGETLKEAILTVDLASGKRPAYYMINCAHPTHFETLFADAQPWSKRIRSLRANASTKSHAELDEATELDAGDPVDLGMHYAHLRCQAPQLNIFGGCCGTDHRHVKEIFKAVNPKNPYLDQTSCEPYPYAIHSSRQMTTETS